MAKSRVTGGSQLRGSLRQISSGLTVPINEASRKALQPTLKAAKRNLKANGSVESGELLKLLTIRKDPDTGKDKPRHVVGPATTNPAYREAHLVEFGTAPHFQPELHRLHPGAQAKPFLRPAFEETKGEAIKRFGESIGPAIEKRAARLERKRKP